jgi:bacteriorhodopsin
MTFAGDFDWQEIRAAAHHRRLSHKEKIYWAGRERHHFNHFFF